MHKRNLLQSNHEKTGRENGVISARAAADRIPLAHNTFFKAIDAKIAIPQYTAPQGNRTNYSFDPAYIDEIANVIPKGLAGGQKVFTSEIIRKIEEINKKWFKK